jgi:hypothetical protein
MTPAIAKQTSGGELVLRELTRHYANSVAVVRIDLAVAPREFLELLGPGGSRKTTTLMMIAVERSWRDLQAWRCVLLRWQRNQGRFASLLLPSGGGVRRGPRGVTASP